MDCDTRRTGRTLQEDKGARPHLPFQQHPGSTSTSATLRNEICRHSSARCEPGRIARMRLAYTLVRRNLMRRLSVMVTAVITMIAPMARAQPTGPYKVLKTAKVGGEGGF